VYWWLTAISAGGKFVVLGPYDSEESASEYGWSHLGSNFEIEQLSTRDMSKATRMLKKKRLDATRNLDMSLQRAKHKLPDKEIT
jgi:transposase